MTFITVYLWGYLKSRVYTNPVPHNTEQLKRKHQETGQADQADDSRISSREFAQNQNLVFQEGSWFEQIVNY